MKFILSFSSFSDSSPMNFRQYRIFLSTLGFLPFANTHCFIHLKCVNPILEARNHGLHKENRKTSIIGVYFQKLLEENYGGVVENPEIFMLFLFRFSPYFVAMLISTYLSFLYKICYSRCDNLNNRFYWTLQLSMIIYHA